MHAALPAELLPMITGFEKSDQHVVITDCNGIIIYANAGAEHHTGYSKKEMMGSSPGKLWGGNMTQEFYEEMWETVLTHKQCFVGDMQNKNKDGTLYWQEMHIIPILDKHGEVLYFIGIELDVNEQERREKLLQECSSDDVCRQALRVRWPLDWLFESGNLSEQQLYELQQSYKNEKILDALTDDLLAISNVLFAHKEGVIEFSPITLLKEVIDEIKVKYPDRHYELSYDSESTLIRENKKLLHQLLNRIITNAAQYTHPHAGDIAIILLKTGNQFVVRCNDNGIGISLNDQRRMFKKFFRGVKARAMNPEGSGLGLYLVKTIADACGWNVVCMSEPEKGACFEVQIPQEEHALAAA